MIHLLPPESSPSSWRRAACVAVCLLGFLGLGVGATPVCFAAPALAAPGQNLPQDEDRGDEGKKDKDENEKRHTHKWEKKTRKVWVDPKIEYVKVGTDKNGKAIYKKRVVRPGYYKQETYYVCSCGQVR